MNKLKDFDIEVFSIKDNTHLRYDFELDDSFFTLFEDSLIQKGSLHVEVDIEKTALLIRSSFKIDGTVELICDRTLDPFEYPIHSENPILFKYAEEEGEITEEIVGIKRETVKINVAQYIYEFIGLEVPIKKLHPRFEEEDQDVNDNTLIYSTGSSEEDKNNKDAADGDIIDPRWLALKTLKDKNKLN
jgi:uncharacterized protein